MRLKCPKCQSTFEMAVEPGQDVPCPRCAAMPLPVLPILAPRKPKTLLTLLRTDWRAQVAVTILGFFAIFMAVSILNTLWTTTRNRPTVNGSLPQPSGRKIAETESAGDQRRRDHIYSHIASRLRQEAFAKEMAALNAGFNPPPVDTKKIFEEMRGRYDNMPVSEVYDIARFNYGYKEPR